MLADDAVLLNDTILSAIHEAVAEHNPRRACEIRDKIGLPELALLDSDDGYTRVCAIQNFARLLVDRLGDVVSAAALFSELVRIVEQWSADDPQWPVTMQTLITSYASLAIDAGRGRDVCASAECWLSVLEGLDNATHVQNLRLSTVEALINDGFYERARGMLALVPPDTATALIPIRTRLAGKIDSLLKRPDERLAPIDAAAVLRETLDHFGAATPDAPIVKLLSAGSIETLEQGDLGMPAFPSVPKTLDVLDRRSETLLHARSPLMALQAVLQGAGATLAPASGDGEALATIARVADRAIAAADTFGYWEEAVTAGWIGVVANRRADRHAAAVERMLALIDRIESRRRLIDDPRLRAGIAIYLPQLPWALVESAMRAGESTTALFGVEMSKARILGDLRLGDRAVQISPQSLGSGLQWRREGRGAVHMLAFLLDTETPEDVVGDYGVRGLLRTADGEIIASEIGLTPVSIRAAARTIDRMVRGLEGGGGFMPIFTGNPWRRSFEPVQQVLAPLVAWLEPLLEDGRLRRGDTIVYSADGPLHNIPMAMVPFAGATFIDSFALAAMPSLALAMTRSPAPRPSAALAVLAPTPGERARGQTYLDEVEFLSALMPTTILTAIEDVPERPSANLMHFAAHGTFDETMPLRGGGLVVGVRDGSYREEDPHYVIEPEQLAGLAMDGAHLTMRACMVGRATQITSREALGAVWGTLAAGAASVVAAGWTVSIPSAARWCTHFYEGWLERGLSRAAAHREACLALRGESAAYAHPAHWAAFVLYVGTLEGDCV